MFLTKSPKLFGIAAAFVALLGFGAPAQAETEFRIATLAPNGSTWMKILSKGAEAIEKNTDGRVKVKYYTGGVQGDEREVVRKMRLKQLDGASVTSVGLAMIDESIRVLELPMLFDSVEEMEYVADRMWPYFQKKFAKKGYKLLDRGELGWIYFMSKSPIKEIKDIRSTKAWLWSDDTLVRAMYKKMNINGVPLGVPEVLPGLTSGRINACYGSPLAAVALQWNTKVKYMTSMPLSFGIAATVLRKDVFDKTSAADQKIQDKIHKKVSKKLRSHVRRDNKSAHKQMTRKGVKVVETPAAMIAEFKTNAEAIWQSLAGKVYSKKELEMVLKFRKQYRDKHGK